MNRPDPTLTRTTSMLANHTSPPSTTAASAPASTFLSRLAWMIAVMVAFQAELIWRRAKPLGARPSDKTPTAG